MRFLRYVLVAILALALGPVAVHGQAADHRRIISAYDLTSTSFIFVLMDQVEATGPGSIKTSGSSTTVTENIAADPDPFAPISVGDEIAVFSINTGAWTRRTVTAKASDVSITVDTAVDWSAGFPFHYKKLRSGTTATDGWMTVSGFNNKLWNFGFTTINATSIDAKIECRMNQPNAVAVIIYPPTGGTGNCGTGNFTATGQTCAHSDMLPWESCRVGLKVNTDTGAQSITISYSASDPVGR